MLIESFKEKRVLLTGHTGFKGAWMLLLLNSLGAKVCGYSLAPQSRNDLYVRINGDNFCQSVIADIRDIETLKKTIIEFSPDFIFHMAAQPLVLLSYEQPVETFSVNTLGTAYLLSALKELSQPCVAVMITTDKVYENIENHHYYKETDRLGGHDPYSTSKACAELIIDSYRKSFFSPESYEKHQKSISSARSGNVIGGGDWAKDRIIPDIIRALCAGEPVTLRNPQSIRPWQHVLEPLSGYLTLAAYQAANPLFNYNSYNFGPNPSEKLTVQDVAQEAIRLWGHGEYQTPKMNHPFHEANLLQLDICKAKNDLRWEPRYTSLEAIQKTIEWYQNTQIHQANAYSETIRQISEYLNHQPVA